MTKSILFALVILTLFCCKNEKDTLKTNVKTETTEQELEVNIVENEVKNKPQVETYTFTNATKNTYVITAKSGLSVRAKPSLSAKKIAKLDYMSQTSIEEVTTEPLTITDNNKIIKGLWVKIKNKTAGRWDYGYVFNGFLQEKQAYIKANKKILTPSTYGYYTKKSLDELSQYWKELYSFNDKYYIGTPKYKKERGYSECSGDSLTSIITARKVLLYINDLTLTTGNKPLKHITPPSKTLWPGNEFTFNFNNENYTIKASGQFSSNDRDNGYNEKKELIFSLLHEGKTEILYKQDEFNDTVCTIKHILDIDSDGKPDFIIDGPRHYEEERTILLMSSDANEDKLIKKRAEIVLDFGC